MRLHVNAGYFPTTARRGTSPAMGPPLPSQQAPGVARFKITFRMPMIHTLLQIFCNNDVVAILISGIQKIRENKMIYYCSLQTNVCHRDNTFRRLLLTISL